MSTTPPVIRWSLLSLLTFSLLTVSAKADGLDGVPNPAPGDPKDMSCTVVGPSEATGEVAFQPMPGWARPSMPPLPDTLKPDGKRIVALKPTPAPLAPPVEKPAPVAAAKPAPAPAPASAPDPALVAISPFLQWIKANPQAAAAQARQQGAAYQMPPSAAPTGPVANGAPGAAPTDSPYWLPPLLDNSSGDVTASSGGSAAIYSTPQR